MDIKKIIVTGRMYKDLEQIALLDNKREYTFIPEAEVSPSHFDWADGYVAFKPTESFHFARLRWVHALGAGVDSFLYNREWKKDVLLTRTVGSFGRKIGEYCLSYILADVQRHDKFQQYQTQRQWLPSQQKLLQQLNIVIFGTGTIGKEVARMLRSFGVTVYGISRSGASNCHFNRVIPITEVHSLLAQADWVINTLPLTPITEKLFGMHLFSYLHGAGFINVGRGASVDENALLEAIERGQVRRAVLDVFREEPLPAQSPMWAHPNVVITPHISAVTGLDEAMDSLLAVLGEIDSGQERISHSVDVSRGY
ncbi:D-2-hydroxyacid dehydrogenase [Paenibacillus alginolyticus]|uniref:D-2-hydroxyacid dehydrogenase n=1 Tax=Paenibacillus alginolyticus TaxID=59839 RepID=A0ABT4GP60_9BACL|nr:D-2-hydroxyacid dehydrogenase [Paenibacillus alginolyticus]MCY9664327.1 D-2-hydroxyacid dehydrogenase [Paenibacillus alginolyticus]MCY9698002.1 D-2-hydroxyacid dehydrogenase [Paenibacillus alginolyticus]MEC0148459.1 D-2-hydroxyacid dehydrogenase [Paenibacillus alginolyticus]